MFAVYSWNQAETIKKVIFGFIKKRKAMISYIFLSYLLNECEKWAGKVQKTAGKKKKKTCIIMKHFGCKLIVNTSSHKWVTQSQQSAATVVYVKKKKYNLNIVFLFAFFYQILMIPWMITSLETLILVLTTLSYANLLHAQAELFTCSGIALMTDN